MQGLTLTTVTSAEKYTFITRCWQTDRKTEVKNRLVILITLANGLENVGPDLDPKLLTLC